jgi:hypothetical protein
MFPGRNIYKAVEKGITVVECGERSVFFDVSFFKKFQPC